MTLAEAIYRRSLNLPEQAAREALDFIEFLEQRYAVQAKNDRLFMDSSQLARWGENR